MTLTESVRRVLTNYALFNGRASRSEYWWFILAYVVLIFIASGLDQSGTLAGLISLVLLIPTIAVATRRLHDSGRSGWWQLISLIPVIGTIVLIVWLAKPGDDGPNRFGERLPQAMTNAS